MNLEKNKNIGFGLRGHNIVLPNKLNVKGITGLTKKSVS